MAVSTLEIWNAALSTVGQRADISDYNESTVVAKQCRQFYPLALRTCLSFHPWSFATSRVAMPIVEAETFGWRFAYVAPPEELKIFYVIPKDEKGIDKNDYPFEMRMTPTFDQKLILTDVERASCLYTISLPQTGTRWFSPPFENALIVLLASYITGVTEKGQSGMNGKAQLYQMYTALIQEAANMDAQQSRGKPSFTPSWLAARR